MRAGTSPNRQYFQDQGLTPGMQLSSRLPKVARQEKCLAIVDKESSGYNVLIQIVKETAAAMRVALSDRMESRI